MWLFLGITAFVQQHWNVHFVYEYRNVHFKRFLKTMSWDMQEKGMCRCSAKC